MDNYLFGVTNDGIQINVVIFDIIGNFSGPYTIKIDNGTLGISQ